MIPSPSQPIGSLSRDCKRRAGRRFGFRPGFGESHAVATFDLDSFKAPIPQGHGVPHLQFDALRTEHPVDTIERLAAHNQWPFDRDDEDEISICVAGGWTDYNVAFTWLSELEALHIACAFDLKTPSARRTELAALLSLIDEQLWIGHFDLWPNEGVILFRHAMVLAGGVELNGLQCHTVLAHAIRACEKYYQAIQFVLWAGKSSREAIETVMLEPQGEA